MENALYFAMKARVSKYSDSDTILPFSQTFKRECEIIRDHQEEAVWLLLSYLRDPTRATFQRKMCLQGYKPPTSVTRYFHVMNHLLGTYTFDDIVAMTAAYVKNVFV